jgi:hypothetical protein
MRNSVYERIPFDLDWRKILASRGNLYIPPKRNGPRRTPRPK